MCSDKNFQLVWIFSLQSKEVSLNFHFLGAISLFLILYSSAVLMQELGSSVSHWQNLTPFVHFRLWWGFVLVFCNDLDRDLDFSLSPLSILSTFSFSPIWNSGFAPLSFFELRSQLEHVQISFQIFLLSLELFLKILLPRLWRNAFLCCMKPDHSVVFSFIAFCKATH